MSQREKKPKGWYSAAQKQARREARDKRRWLREHNKARADQKRRRIARLAADTARAAGPIILKAAIKAAKDDKAMSDPTVARTAREAQQEARKQRADLNEKERVGNVMATPERTVRAGGLVAISTTTKKGRTIHTQVVADWPIARLHRAKLIGKGEVAHFRLEAAERLYAHWYHGRLLPLGSRDYRKPYSGGSDAAFAVMPATERQAFHRNRYREADACLGGDRIAAVTRAIVLDEKEPVEVGRVVTGRQQEQQARAVAIEYLIDGLDRLRPMWGLQTKAERRALDGVHGRAV